MNEKNEAIIINSNYELRLTNKPKAVLILFPCFPCSIEHTKNEALFLKDLNKDGISTLIVNDNEKLFLKDDEKINLENKLFEIFEKHKIPLDNVYMGGFSSGGNIVMLLANDLIKQKSKLQPKGIFIVDSPIDLEKLYNDANNDIKNNNNTIAVKEGEFLINFFNTQLGSPKNNRSIYKKYSPFLISEYSQENMKYLNHVKIRFYSEPDLDWQNENRNRKYEDLNAYAIENATMYLKKAGNENTTFIQTQNRGKKADGSKHPHSWNLVERKSLIEWMLN